MVVLPGVLHPIGIAIARAILERDGDVPPVSSDNVAGRTQQTDWILAPFDRAGPARAARRSPVRSATADGASVHAPTTARGLAAERIIGGSVVSRQVSPAAASQTGGGVAGRSAFRTQPSGGQGSHDPRWLLFLAFLLFALSGIVFALAAARDRWNVDPGVVVARLRSRTLGGSHIVGRRGRTGAARPTSAIRYRE